MRTWILRTPWIVAASLSLAGVMSTVPMLSAAAQPPAEWDGLTRMPDKGGDHVYLLRQADFSGYTHVRVAPVQVSFDENWQPNRGSRSVQRTLSNDDMERLREGLADEFHKTFEEQLTRAGYMISAEDGDHVLDVAPAIVNLYITAPNTQQTPGRSRTYVSNTGRMTLILELRDSVSGQLVGRVVDTQSGRRSGRGFNLASPVTNLADARSAITSWGRATVEAIDYAKSSSATAVAEKQGNSTPR
jgi:Protein of unknown function (DUF3313)